MKHRINKILRRKTDPEQAAKEKITNQTIAEHRERIIAGGRKFKYPHQYTKHRIVLVSVIVVIVATFLLGLIGYWQLYSAQNTSKFMHSLTKIFPLPVAKVDGSYVPYSHYLTELRSAIHYLTTKEAVNFKSSNNARQLEREKRLALDKAIESTYVAKLAKQLNLSVSEQEVDDFIKNQIESNKLGVTEQVYHQVIRDYYDWSFTEYRQSIARQLLRKKVLAQIDHEGRKKAEKLLEDINKGKKFATVARAESDDILTKGQGGETGLLDASTPDPSGLISTVKNLKKGEVSGIIEGADGFYIVKMLDKQGGTINFAKILVAYKELGNRLETLRKDGRIKEYIKINSDSAPIRN